MNPIYSYRTGRTGICSGIVIAAYIIPGIAIAACIVSGTVISSGRSAGRRRHGHRPGLHQCIDSTSTPGRNKFIRPQLNGRRSLTHSPHHGIGAVRTAGINHHNTGITGRPPVRCAAALRLELAALSHLKAE